jgi:hypothetical protein
MATFLASRTPSELAPIRRRSVDRLPRSVWIVGYPKVGPKRGSGKSTSHAPPITFVRTHFPVRS